MGFLDGEKVYFLYLLFRLLILLPCLGYQRTLFLYRYLFAGCLLCLPSGAARTGFRTRLRACSRPSGNSRLTAAPAGIIGSGYGELGTLKIGEPADITVFDPNQEWTVDPKIFASKGKNTPLSGTRLKGKVIMTIARGKLAYRDSPAKFEEKAATGEL